MSPREEMGRHHRIQDKSHHNALNTLGRHDEKGNVNSDNPLTPL